MGLTYSQKIKRARQRADQSGQIIVEYVLLLIVATLVAAIIINTMVSRNPDNPGFLISKWDQILGFIGSDKADDVTREE